MTSSKFAVKIHYTNIKNTRSNHNLSNMKFSDAAFLKNNSKYNFKILH